jgi:hypothetical protein|tara:strand:- start:753 stop:1469 length:717 start_codon:yes stop_codon:yes gene_type:complete
MKHITLLSEKDFGKLNFLPFNRSYHVRNDLINNMNIFGFTVPIILLNTDIIDGKRRYFVIDGQHRCASAQYLKIPIEAIVFTQEETNIETLEDIVNFVSSMNSASKPWSLLNYVEAYNFLNYPEYHKLITITNSCPYTVNTVAAMLMGFRSRTSGANAKVKEGKFVSYLYNETLYTLELASKLSKYERLTSRMVLALHYVASLKSFDEGKFIAMYKDKSKQLKELKLDDYTDVFSSWL